MYLCATEVALVTISLRLGEKLSMCGALLMVCLTFIHRTLMSTLTNVKRQIAFKTHPTHTYGTGQKKGLKNLNVSLQMCYCLFRWQKQSPKYLTNLIECFAQLNVIAHNSIYKVVRVK